MKKVAKCAKKQGYRLTTLIKIERIISDMIFALLYGTWKGSKMCQKAKYRLKKYASIKSIISEYI